MGKANYINRVNSFIPMKDYKLRYALNLGYDDIIEDVNELSKIKTFDTVEALQDYATNNPTAYIGQQCVLKGNPSSVYVINENKTITLIATSSNINSLVNIDLSSVNAQMSGLQNQLSYKADLEYGKVAPSQIPTNVLLSDGSVQMGIPAEIISAQYLLDSYNNTSINISGDLRSIFSVGDYIKAYGAGIDYYMTILTVAYYSVQNYTRLTFVSQGNISYFFIVKISNIPVIYTPTNPNDISTKEYVDTKQEIVIFDNTIEQQTLISTDKILIQDTIGSFKWISFANLKRQLGLQVGQKYLGGTIIKLNKDGTSGVIASYDEFDANYTDALATYSVNGLYSSNGYSNWRLPTISELNLLLTHSKPERALIGDVNNDGIINNEDYALIEEGLYKDSTDSEWNTKWYRADVDGNGIIDGDDQNAVDNLINGGGGSIFTKLKYLSIDLSQINPLTHCKGYSAPALSMINGVITVVPHALIEIPIVDIVGVRLVRNF